MNWDKEDSNDYFDSTDVPEEKPKEPKRPSLKPENPDYWEEDESEWEHLRPRRSAKPWLYLGGALVVACMLVAVYLRYFSPYVTDAVQFGYVENIEHRGTVFQTYEGVLIPYKELMDTTRVYSRDFIFTAADEKVAVKLKQAQLDARPVMVGYRRYHATLPWRGASKTIVTSVDSVNPENILPPDFAPVRHKR